MDEHSIERIRNASFSHSVRGYDRGEVDQFLGELADWLERGGEDDAAVEAVRAELERIGEQTGSILTEAHDAAEAIRADAADDARKQLVDANVTAERLRSGADEYAAAGARGGRLLLAEDPHGGRRVREQVAARGGVRGTAHPRRGRGGRRRTPATRPSARRSGSSPRPTGAAADVEAVISDLEQRRDAVLAELDRLASGIAGTATQHRPRRASPRTARRRATCRGRRGHRADRRRGRRVTAEPAGWGPASEPTSRRALEAALAGGPERHHQKTAEQGKLGVRERVERLVDPESFAEEGLLANWDAEGLGADGVVTGLATIAGRRVCLMANDPTVKAGSWGPKTVEKILRIQERALAPRAADDLPGRLGGRADHRPGPDVPRAPRRRADLLQRGQALRARCRRSACSSARRPRAAPTSRPSATS